MFYSLCGGNCESTLDVRFWRLNVLLKATLYSLFFEPFPLWAICGKNTVFCHVFHWMHSGPYSHPSIHRKHWAFHKLSWKANVAVNCGGILWFDTYQLITNTCSLYLIILSLFYRYEEKVLPCHTYNNCVNERPTLPKSQSWLYLLYWGWSVHVLGSICYSNLRW